MPVIGQKFRRHVQRCGMLSEEIRCVLDVNEHGVLYAHPFTDEQSGTCVEVDDPVKQVPLREWRMWERLAHQL